MESFNPKQAREQKVRRDRRRKDNRRPGDAPSNVEPEVVSSTPKGQRDASNRVRERKPAPAAVETQKSASEGTAAENAEPPELPDFSNLKRETDEIAALTSKKYSKRQIFSNWTKYENPPEVHSEEEDDSRRTDFEVLAHLPVSAGGHFKFKSERSWDVNPSSLYAEYFAVNVESLAQGLAAIPFYDKIELPKSLLTAEELERIDYFAKQSSARYNVTKSSLKEGTYVHDANNHINKILNILSYKENQTNRKTDPSMYENVDEDDQLENKSLVQFSFETNSFDQSSASVDVCVPANNSPSKNDTPVKETQPCVQPDAVSAVTKNISEPSEVFTAHDQTTVPVTSVSVEQNHLGDIGNEQREVLPARITGEEEITPSGGITSTQVPCDVTTSHEDKVIPEEPVIMEQRTGKGKKGSAKAKNKKDERKGKREENNNVVKNTTVTDVRGIDNGTKVCEVEVSGATKQSVGKIAVESAVEVEIKKSDVKLSKVVEKSHVKAVEKASSKSVEQVSERPKAGVKKNPRVDDELDFLLSLKKPVEDVKPKSAPLTQAARSAIDEDESDNKLPLVAQKINEENLEDWLDSMLDD